MASIAPVVGASAAPSASAAPTTGTKPAATPPPAVQAEIKKALARVARPIPDPATGKTFKASQYWDYELGTPFEVEDTTITGLGDADNDGRVETKIVSDVKLPNGKLQAKLMLLGKYALAQADDEEDLDEEIDEDSDDIVWEDDWLVDADGDGEWDEGEGEYAEDYTEEEEDTFLTAPHECEMVVHDAPAMSNQDDLVTVTDKDTGETLTITYDQEWVHFTVKTSGGQGSLEYLPDGSYLVDGEPCADAKAVAQAFEGRPWFRVTSRYALGLVAARLGRLKEESRGTINYSNQPTSYALADTTGMTDTGRSFAIVNALVAAVDAE